MTAKRRMSAVLIAIGLMGLALLWALHESGIGQFVVLMLSAVVLGGLTVLIQLILLATLKHVDTSRFGFFYTYVFASAIACFGFYLLMCRVNYVIARLVDDVNVVFGVHLLFTIPLVLQIVLVICRSVGIRRVIK